MKQVDSWITEKVVKHKMDWPLNTKQAAFILDIGVRRLNNMLLEYPYYHGGGWKKFDPSDMERIWAAMKYPGSKKEEKSGTSGGLPVDDEFTKARKRLGSPRPNTPVYRGEKD